MPTIRKRGRNQWQAIVKRAGFPLASKTFAQRSDATAWARMLESKMDQRTWTPSRAAEETPFRKLIEKYREDVLPGMRGKHFGPALTLLEKQFGAQAVAQLTSQQIAAFRNQRLRAGRSASTVRKELNLLSRILDLAGAEWGVALPNNPCKTITRPAEHNARTRRLRPGEEHYLLAATRAEVAELIQIALETAARLGELLSLEWANVDLQSRVATTYGTGKQGTKNGAPLRSIPLSMKAVALLESMPRSDRRVFPTWQASDSFNKAWRAAIVAARNKYEKDCEANGSEPDPTFLDDLRFHDLRHEATSRLFERRKLDSMEIATITGHKTVSIPRQSRWL